MNRVVPKAQVGTQREHGSQYQPSDTSNRVGQGTLPTITQSEVNETRRRLRELFRVAADKFGKYEVLARELGKEKPENYKGKISDAICAVGAHKVQLEWLAPIILKPDACEVFLRGFCELTNYAMPEKLTAPEPTDLVGPMIDQLDRMGDPGSRAIEELAKQRGVTVETLRRACGR